MAQKLFKGFMQVTEGSFAPENGYIYFVRNSANTGHTDGYLQFNGKKYGTAEEAKNDLESLIGALPEGYTNVVDYIQGTISGITDNFSTETQTGSSNGVSVSVGQANGNVTAVTVTAPDFENIYASKSDFEAVSGTVKTINGDYLKATDKTELNNAITAETAARESADSALGDRLDSVEAKLNGIEAGAEVNVQADWNEADNTSDAFILNKPTGLTQFTNDGNFVRDANYVHTDANYTEAEKTKLAGIAEGAQVNVIETVKVNGTALTVSDKAVDVVIPAAAEYTIVKQAEAEEGYLATYALTKDGTQVGANINIPKDFLVRSAEVKTVTTADDPYQGASVGDKYIDFVINTSGATTGGDHIYLPVNELVDVYTDGDGIDVSADNIISVQIDSANANGLSVGSKGVALALATDASAGAMSAADHTKLTNAAAQADLNALSGAVEAIETNAATKTEVGVLSGRVDTLEAISGDSHTHGNKAVLDGISAEKVSAWNAAEQNAKNYADGLKNAMNADISGASNGVEVGVKQVSGVVTEVNVTAPNFDDTYAPKSLTGTVETNRTAFDSYTAATDTRLGHLETSAATFATTAVTDALDGRIDTLETNSATKTEVGTLSGRVDTLETDLNAAELAIVSADTRLDSLEAIDADTRLDALEALTGSSSTALQSISAADNSVAVGQKDSNKNQTVGVKISQAANNGLSLNNDGLFIAAIYYDGDDSE